MDNDDLYPRIQKIVNETQFTTANHQKSVILLKRIYNEVMVVILNFLIRNKLILFICRLIQKNFLKHFKYTYKYYYQHLINQQIHI